MLNYAAGSSVVGYNLTRSLRFRASASAYLNRTPATTTDQKTFTLSQWVKRGTLNSAGNVGIAVAGTGAAEQNRFMFVNDTLWFDRITGGGVAWNLQTTQVFRDPSAWYHIVLAVDTTQATAANRVKLYVNGSQITAFTTANYPALNATLFFNANVAIHRIGTGDLTPQYYFDGYIAETYFIDGQALTPSSFGATNALTGVWQPAAYTGTYGTNGFYLPFTDNSALTTSSNVGLGRDYSGNGNYWTTNNISITAGQTYDSMTDVPTLTSATAANYCVLNPLDQSTNWTLSDANLKCRRSTGTPTVRATFALPSSGKYYFEYLQELGTDASNVIMYGLCSGARGLNAGPNQTGDYSLYCAANGFLVQNGVSSGNIGTIPSVSQIVQVAVDVDNSKMWFGINNSWYIAGGATTGNPSTGANPTLTGALGGLFPMVYVDATVNTGTVINFGQRPFAYTPPTGFVALNTFNLPTATILKGNTVMDATLYTGDGTSPKTRTNAAGFQPDLVWIKSRSSAYSHNLFDSVRGAGAARSLQSDNTNSEATNAANTALYGYLSAFNANGFSTTNGVGDIWVNQNGANYVAWQWQAGQGSSASNTNGSITSTVSVNASAGFSVVTYTGNGTAGATIGHGLGVAPKFIYTITRSPSGNVQQVYHSSIGNTGAVFMNSTQGTNTAINWWNNTSPTSSVFSLGSGSFANGSGSTMVAYCWAEIDGFSKFGSYVGNSNADGPFIYLGFRPKFVMFKGSTFDNNWYLVDSSVNAINVAGAGFKPNATDAEIATSTTQNAVDFLSNGFKLRNNAAAVAFNNSSGQTFIYAAFAENPFKNSLAR